MNPFIFQNPTKLLFGKGKLSALKDEPMGERVLLVYGGGSIKKNGIYQQVTDFIQQRGITFVELSGVEPNPKLSTVREGIELCRQEQVDFILAVGGGSVIDCAKAIAAGVKYSGDVWDLIASRVQAQDALPIGTVLTLAATGSEMNGNSVITNWETHEKYGWSSPYVMPRFSILDPEFTYSVPADQTVYGIVDIMSHVFEQYFHHQTDTPVQDQFSESILRTVIKTAPKLMKDLSNYEYRKTIMYCGTVALNGFLSMGVNQDWATHDIEHELSAFYDIPHGGGLAILFPNWMKYCLDENVGRFKQFAIQVFGIDPSGKKDREVAEEGIQALRKFWDSLGAPNRLADYEIDDRNFKQMAEKAVQGGTIGSFKKLTAEDVYQIYQMSL